MLKSLLKLFRGKQNMDTAELKYIELKISEWKSSPKRKDQFLGDAYYQGRHEILQRKRMTIGKGGALSEIGNLPNNQIVDNQYAKMVDQKKNYLLAQPIVFETDNDSYTESLKAIFDKAFMRIIKNVGLDSINGGLGWIHPYYNEAGEFKFKAFPAYEILPFWANKEHTELKAAARVYLEENEKNKIVEKCDLYTPTGIYYFDLKNGKLVTNGNRLHQDYLTLESDEGEQGYNWAKIPLIPFKYNSNEQPLITRCKSIQDAINKITSDFVNGMEENAGGNSILVLQNYDGEKLDEFRDKLSKYRAIKIRSTEGHPGDVRTLEIAVDSNNYDVILKLLKRQLIENCRGFDAKDDKLGGNPNQMNIKTALADLDSDANDFETELQSSLDDLLWFVNQHLANTGVGNFENEDVEIIFNRDNIINETEIMNMLISAGVQIPNEVLLRQVPFLDDVDEALKLLAKQKEEEQDVYGGALPMDGVNDDDEE